MSVLKIILADSNNLIRLGLKTVLESKLKTLEIVEAASGKILLKTLSSFTPDVVLIDYTAKEFSIETLFACRSKYPNLKIVAITFEQSGKTVVNALKAGVMSYVKKDCDLQEIADSVSETAKGNQFFCGNVLQTIRSESIVPEDIEFEPFDCEPITLSERELEVIALIAEGYTNNQVADKLFLSNHTVTTHRKNIMNKLGVNNTAGIVMYAVKANLVSANKFLFSSNI